MKKWMIGLMIALLPMASHGALAIAKQSCDQWMNHKTVATQLWLLGYISGMNAIWVAWVSKGDDPLSQLSSSGQIDAWMDKFCRNNPLEKLDTGAQLMFMDLFANAKKK